MIGRFCLIALATSLLMAFARTQPLPVAGEAAVSNKDSMRMHHVPAGVFMMGNDDGWAGQRPAHEIRLSAFSVDEAEVTNRMYALCVQAGERLPPKNVSSYTRDRYHLDTEYAEYPVVHVTWQEASIYCAWAGRVLPSEAQGEKAAHGTDGRLYPWGNQAPDEHPLNNFDVSFLEDIVEVGSYPHGASPYAALDMAGNVWEWTADWFHPYPGGDLAASESYGQTYRVLRGGSFVDAADATTRYPNDPQLHTHDIGFRCVLAMSSAAD